MLFWEKAIQFKAATILLRIVQKHCWCVSESQIQTAGSFFWPCQPTSRNFNLHNTLAKGLSLCQIIDVCWRAESEYLLCTARQSQQCTAVRQELGRNWGSRPPAGPAGNIAGPVRHTTILRFSLFLLQRHVPEIKHSLQNWTEAETLHQLKQQPAKQNHQDQA